MAFKNFGTLLLTGAAQRLSSVFADPANFAKEDLGLAQLFLQADGANANPIFIGDDSTVSTTVYGMRLEKGAAGVPPVPLTIGPFDGSGVKVSNLWVFGTAGEKLRICGVPA